MARVSLGDIGEATGTPGWSARLKLVFETRGARTVATHREHCGPLVVQRPFYPEGGTCHVYLLHPPGGVVAGDRLQVEANAEPGAQVLLTTPAATKLYRSHGPRATLAQDLRIEAGARLEWFPQGSIFFNGCRVSSATRVEVAPGGQFAGWEIIALGRLAAGELFDRGHCRQAFEIWSQGRPLMLDRAEYAGGSPVLQAAWGLAGYSVVGSFAAYPANRAALEAVRARIPGEPWFSASLLDDLLICRYLGNSVESAQQNFVVAWEALRPILFGRPACPPRIWNT